MDPERPLTEQDVAGIADYARIALDPDELRAMTVYLNEAVALLAPIRAPELEGVEPTFHPIAGLANVTRPDVADPARALPLEDALGSAAARVGRSFRVPAILAEAGGGR